MPIYQHAGLTAEVPIIKPNKNTVQHKPIRDTQKRRHRTQQKQYRSSKKNTSICDVLRQKPKTLTNIDKLISECHRLA